MLATIKFTQLRGAGNDYMYQAPKNTSCPKNYMEEQAGRRSNSGHGSSLLANSDDKYFRTAECCKIITLDYGKRIQKNICLYVKSTFSGFHEMIRYRYGNGRNWRIIRFFPDEPI